MLSLEFVIDRLNISTLVCRLALCLKERYQKEHSWITFIVLFIATFESVDEIFKCDHLNEGHYLVHSHASGPCGILDRIFTKGGPSILQPGLLTSEL